MNDVIAGLCVLANMSEGLDFLYCIQQHADGRREHSHIPCVEIGHPKRLANPPFPIWNYRRMGDHLDFNPSVHDTSSGFHNAANWSVRFVELNPKVDSIDLDQLHDDLNQTPETHGVAADYQENKIQELIAQGILLPIP